MTIRSALIVSIVVTVAGVAIVASGATYRLPGDQTGYRPVQPIAYSHKVHAGDNRIPCQTCHTGAERGPMAGVPTGASCMNCHRVIAKDRPEIKKLAAAVASNTPIRWRRIHALPEHAVFDHSRHVNTGVACQTCHGAIETMDRVERSQAMTMGFCVNCHRAENGRAHTDSITGARVVRATSTDCSSCHH